MKRLSEAEFVERFGSEQIKEKYKQEGRLKVSTQKYLIQQAKKEFNTVSVSHGTYKISGIKKDIDVKGVYQYTCPLILDYLIDEKKCKKIVTSNISLANEINMISEYYKSLSHNPDKVSDITEIDINIVYDYFSHATQRINYYIEKTLEHLEKMCMVIYKNNYLIQETNNVSVVGCQVEIQSQWRIANDDDMKIYSNALEISDRTHNIKTKNERYYGHKAFEWKKTLFKELGKHNIMNIVSAFEVYPVNLDKCKSYREQFYKDDRRLIKSMVSEIKDMLYSNAIKRNEGITDEETLETCYKILSNICIGKPKVKKQICEELELLKSNGSKYSLIVDGEEQI